MKSLTRLPSLYSRVAVSSSPRNCRFHVPTQKSIHTRPPLPASVSEYTIIGPPPPPPVPESTRLNPRKAHRRGQASSQRDQNLEANSSPKTKRFWKDVHIKHTDEGYQIHLDTRPIRRNNAARDPLTIPSSKAHLATALALEWNLLTSSNQATKQHYIPLTSLVSRALDIIDDDNVPSSDVSIRSSIAEMVMKYLDTDSLLCWEPERVHTPSRNRESLRSVQKRTAAEIVSFLTEKLWPGLEIVPVLGEESIVPREQPEVTREVIKGWVSGLPGWELAALERAVLAGKGLLGGVRLIVEWSERLGLGGRERDGEGTKIFGIEEAAKAASLEVDWQTEMWGEVEDSHDVDKEEIRRQFGSVVLLVSGDGRSKMGSKD